MRLIRLDSNEVTVLFTDQIIKKSWCVRWPSLAFIVKLDTSQLQRKGNNNKWSKDSTKHLFQNMRPILWIAQPSFWNTPSNFWGFNRVRGKGSAKSLKSSTKCLKSSTMCMCYNTAHAVPISHGKRILKTKFEFVFMQII